METNVIKKYSASEISTESKMLVRRKSEGVSNMIIEKKYSSGEKYIAGKKIIKKNLF